MKIIPVIQEDMILLEKAFYELSGLKGLVNQCTGQSEFKVSGDEYKVLLEDYLDKFKEVEVLKTELIKKYVIPLINDTQTYDCNFDFARVLIQADIKGE